MFDSDIQAIVRLEQEGGLGVDVKKMALGMDSGEA